MILLYVMSDDISELYHSAVPSGIRYVYSASQCTCIQNGGVFLLNSFKFKVLRIKTCIFVSP